MNQMRSMPLFQMGFRPFFLFGALHSVLVMTLWIAVQTGKLTGFSTLSPTIWHIHEMVFGFACAIIAGFILTASANWVGMRGLHGWKLFGLFSCWMLGRVVFFLVPFQWLGQHWILLDLIWMPLLLGVLTPPLVKAGKWKNTGLLFILLGLFVCKILITLHLLGYEAPVFAETAFLSPFLVVLLVAIVGGRITPVFTQNKYKTVNVVRRPAWDWASLICMYAFLAFALVSGWGKWTGWMAFAAALCNLVRMSGWKSLATWKDPIYGVMHLAYLFIPIGFGVLWLSLTWNLLARSFAIHILNTGVIGLFVLGMITRVSKGHTGRPIHSDKVTNLAYLCVLISLVFRTLVPAFWPQQYLHALLVSGLTWSMAFGLFLVKYTGILLKPRPDGKAG